MASGVRGLCGFTTSIIVPKLTAAEAEAAFVLCVGRAVRGTGSVGVGAGMTGGGMAEGAGGAVGAVVDEAGGGMEVGCEGVSCVTCDEEECRFGGGWCTISAVEDEY